MNKSQLFNLRNNLGNINDEIFSLYTKRQDVINQIQALKNNLALKAWDPKRELELFSKIDFSDDLTLAASYSFLLEAQSSSVADYPKWSQGKHLMQTSGSLSDFINPILLFILNRSQYKTLKLKSEYQTILDEVLNDE